MMRARRAILPPWLLDGAYSMPRASARCRYALLMLEAARVLL